MSPTRDASVSGARLREAHGKIGTYLVWEFLSDVLGVEAYPTQHVQGHRINGYRIMHERETTIVALMRGGEPMALGLSEAMPLAMFVHAKSPDDIKREHIEKQRTVILVDSVINSGKSVIEFIEHTRKMHKTIRIIVVAGVVHKGAVIRGTRLSSALGEYGVPVYALRLSENRFTGRGGTDTGHRLFNTTHMA